jgi:hypothetical protein
VVAELGCYAGGGRAPADHRIGVRLWQHRAGELAGAAADRAERLPLGITAQASAVEIGGEVFLKVVVAGIACRCRPSRAAAQPAVPREDILDRHAERRADPGERIDHEPDQAAITRTGMRRDIDAVEQRALSKDRAPAFARTSRRAGARAPCRPG